MLSRHEKTDSDLASEISRLSADRRLDDVFEQYKSELLGTIYFLYSASDSASKLALEKLRKRCSRNYENSRIGDVRSWVFRVLYTLAFESVGNAKPKRRKSIATVELFSAWEGEPDESNRREQIAYLRSVLLDLSFNERAVFLLRQNGGLTYDEIARTTGLTFEQVRSTMKKTVFRLAGELDTFSRTLQHKQQGSTSFAIADEVEK